MFNTRTAPSSPPPKRIKLDPSLSLDASVNAVAIEDGLKTAPESVNWNLERKVGITEYLNQELEGWKGVLKMRYTDFLVNEIDEEGNVVHLRSWELPKKRAEVKGQKGSGGDDSYERSCKVTSSKQNEKQNGEGKNEPPTFEISTADRQLLITLVGEHIFTSLLEVYKMISTPYVSAGKQLENPPIKPILTPPVNDKSRRKEVHQAIRRIFNGKFETMTLEKDNQTEGQENVIKIVVSSANETRGDREIRSNRRGRGNQGGKFNENGEKLDPYPDGEYLYFTLYKENKDTMDMINLLARIINLPRQLQNRTLSFAGTKDKRAVTVQRCSAFRISPERLAKANIMGGRGMSLPKGCKVGDFEWKRKGLELGDLKGNEFYITLRDARPQIYEDTSEENRLDVQQKRLENIVGKAVTALENDGFINYYGLQRFGTFVKGTHEVGVKMLHKDWKGAIDEIIDYDIQLATYAENNPEKFNVSRDEYDRAKACHIFSITKPEEEDYEKKLEEALAIIPRKFLAENTVIKAAKERVGGNNKLDYLQILMRIPRGLRMMYTHSYQSYVWNHAVSERLKIYGKQNVVEGDLVIAGKGENILKEEADEMALLDQDGQTARREEEFTRASTLSRDEAESGKYSIKDIVLPMPGYDVLYPQNAVMDVYKNLMAKDGLDPENMRRNVKEISLPGSYRNVIGEVMGSVEWAVRRVRGLEQIVETDLEKVQEEIRKKRKQIEAAPREDIIEEIENGGKEPDLSVSGDKLAVTIKLQLGTSMYATMALRELMKEDGLQSYQAEFGSALNVTSRAMR